MLKYYDFNCEALLLRPIILMVYYIITKLRMYNIKIIYGRKVTYMDKYATFNMFETYCSVIPVNCMHGCYHRKPECWVYWEMEMFSLSTTAKVKNSVTHNLISQISVICDQLCIHSCLHAKM